ncbi:MAG: hypothetical protein WCT85_02135 [Parachlamydiales bacterium]|jgi:hypothetical protein
MSSVSFFGCFEGRKYDRFLDDAKIISESAGYYHAKLCWLPGAIPSYDTPHPLQGTVRWIKGFIPGFIADAEHSSEYALNWSVSLINCNSVPSVIDNREEDAKCFLDAYRALILQSKLYKTQNAKASKNYETAANSVYDFASKFFKEEVTSLALSRMGFSLSRNFR